MPQGVDSIIRNARVMIDVGHHKIHEGSAFRVTDPYTAGGALTRVWKITTPIGKKCHLLFQVSADIAFRAMLNENPALGTATWTDKTAYNMNRNSTNTPTTTVKQENAIGTYASGAIILFDEFVGAGSGPTRFGGNSRAEAELILKENEDYGLEVTVGGAGNITPMFEWYEV